ncbi:hypothetical protein K443DRAFT_121290 [Laccaria amethystina LaAM-08-1]|uniref:Uncharacterized protein n=1 Tax=Laccaria amethystina LaAM-08-1 TaxID=1095629 RepID=A0A0C9Y192_9AGAR|nr:hypothetical protein K443DRAFT_121290 [Laccaria amethystina LaAM-08-1]
MKFDSWSYQNSGKPSVLEKESSGDTRVLPANRLSPTAQGPFPDVMTPSTPMARSPHASAGSGELESKWKGVRGSLTLQVDIGVTSSLSVVDGKTLLNVPWCHGIDGKL